MKKILFLVLRIVVAGILIQTLRYKFNGHPDSIYIFTQVGMEPYGRIGIGVLELIAAILLLIPKTVWLAALLTLGIISGAIFFHLTKIGIEVHGDGGTLFYLGLATFLLSGIILWIDRKNISMISDNT